jgi:hypothetical protein
LQENKFFKPVFLGEGFKMKKLFIALFIAASLTSWCFAAETPTETPISKKHQKQVTATRKEKKRKRFHEGNGNQAQNQQNQNQNQQTK